MSVERRGPAICNVSNIGEGKDEMTKASIDLQDLRRRLYVKRRLNRPGGSEDLLRNERASAGNDGIGSGCTTLEGCLTPIECDATGRKSPQQDRSHKLWREANGGAQCGKSARCVVCPAKAGMFSRRQTCRGRSQSPVVWIAEVMETETLKPIDKTSLGEVTSHRAVTKVNALWPRK